MNLRDNGASEEEIEFLLRQRVELNALPSDQLVAWIERKLSEHDVQKIVPDKDMLARAYRAKVRGLEIKRAVAKMTKEQTDHVKVPRDLNKKVAAFLNKHPHVSWDDAVISIVDECGELSR